MEPLNLLLNKLKSIPAFKVSVDSHVKSGLEKFTRLAPAFGSTRFLSNEAPEGNSWLPVLPQLALTFKFFIKLTPDKNDSCDAFQAIPIEGK